MTSARWLSALGFLGVAALAAAAPAAPLRIGLADFSGSESVVTYDGVPYLVPVDGRTFGGVLHEVVTRPAGAIMTFGGTVSGAMYIDPPLVAGDGGKAVLSLTLPEAANRFGFGFVLNSGEHLADVVRLTTYDTSGITLGELTFDAEPDLGTGSIASSGFAALQDTSEFVRVEIRFGSWIADPGGIGGPVFLLDNLRFEAVVPTPGALVSLLATALGLALRRFTPAGG